MAYALGGLTILVLWLVYGVVTGSWNPARIVQGKDGRPSTSKFQWFLWTIVVIFSYAAVFAVKVITGQFGENIAIPNNVLLAMGFSTASTVTAKYVGLLQARRGRKRTFGAIREEKRNALMTVHPEMEQYQIEQMVDAETEGPIKATGWGGLVEDDDGAPDLSKIQMLAWTGIAVAVYLFALSHQITLPGPPETLTELPDVSTLPDIDGTLIALMGLGQGGYLGKKIAELT